MRLRDSQVLSRNKDQVEVRFEQVGKITDGGRLFTIKALFSSNKNAQILGSFDETEMTGAFFEAQDTYHCFIGALYCDGWRGCMSGVETAMTIRDDLKQLIILQDSITHLNVTGQAGEPHAPTPEFKRLQKQRDALREQIALRVEAAEQYEEHRAWALGVLEGMKPRVREMCQTVKELNIAVSTLGNHPRRTND